MPPSRGARRSSSRAATARRRSPVSTADAVRDKLKTLLQMAVVLTYAASVPVVKIGRMAGQFAKPRSKLDRVARRGRAALPTAATRSTASTSRPRRAAPTRERLLQAYHSAAVTLNLCRAFTERRLRRPAPGARLEPGLRRREPGRAALRAARRRDRPRAGVHEGLRRRRQRSCTGSSSTPATRRCCSTTSAR